MEDRKKNYFPGLPPVSPKSFKSVSPSTTLFMTAEQKSHLMNHDEVGSSGTKPHLGLFGGISSCFPSIDVSNKKTQLPPPLSRNPITSVAPSSINDGGITVKTEQGIDYEMKLGRTMTPDMDTRRIRRILSNRISAQKSRMKKVQYLNGLEMKAKELQAQIALLIPRIEREEEENKLVQVEHRILKETVRVYEDRAEQSLAAIEEKKAEVKRLRELYASQQKMNMQEELMKQSWNSVGMEQMVNCGSHEARSHSQAMVDQEELDPALNFDSLTIDPPMSLM